MSTIDNILAHIQKINSLEGYYATLNIGVDVEITIQEPDSELDLIEFWEGTNRWTLVLASDYLRRYIRGL